MPKKIDPALRERAVRLVLEHRAEYDNALMETINGLYKTECIRTTVFHAGPYKTLADVEYATAGWVDWYNNRRLHGTLGMLSPIEHESASYGLSTRIAAA